MFKIGDFVVHGKAGVCKVTGISAREVPGSEGDRREYYELDPVYGRFTVYSPVDNTTVYMRPVISRKDAEKLIDCIPDIQAQPYINSKQPELIEHYSSIIKTHDVDELVALTVSLYNKQQGASDGKNTFGSIDRRFIAQAEDTLFGELAVSLGIEKNEVQPYIAARLEKKKRPRLFRR
jgi:CarD family transcriptional regulator